MFGYIFKKFWSTFDDTDMNNYFQMKVLKSSFEFRLLKLIKCDFMDKLFISILYILKKSNKMF